MSASKAAPATAEPAPRPAGTADADAATATADAPAAAAWHLVVVSHGQWGTRRDVSFLGTCLQDAGGAAFTVHLPTVNHITGTYSGIDVCGARIAADVRRLVEEGGGRYRCLSLVGYSAGGLHMRFAAGELHAEGFFERHRLELHAFVTIATPHLGVRHSARSWVGRTRNGVLWGLSDLYGGRSLTHMMLEDRDGAGGVPLLLSMTVRGSPFMAALGRFRCCYVYANVFNDHSVNYCSAAIAPRNVYRGRRHEALRNPVNGYSHIAAVSPVRGTDPARSAADASSEAAAAAAAAAAQDEGAAARQAEGAAAAEAEVDARPGGVHPVAFVAGMALLTPLVLLHGVLLMVPLRVSHALSSRREACALLPPPPADAQGGGAARSLESAGAGGGADDAASGSEAAKGKAEGNAAVKAAGELQALSPDDVPRVMLENFCASGVDIKRVDVCLDARNTHGAIIIRRGFYKNWGGTDVVRHVTEIIVGADGTGVGILEAALARADTEQGEDSTDTGGVALEALDQAAAASLEM